MKMSIEFDVKIYWSWFKHQDLRHMNAGKEEHLSTILESESLLITNKTTVSNR